MDPIIGGEDALHVRVEARVRDDEAALVHLDEFAHQLGIGRKADEHEGAGGMQLRQGFAPPVLHDERLELSLPAELDRLGVGSERELADAVRAGSFDDRTDELLAALRETVSDRLRVANPRYLGE